MNTRTLSEQYQTLTTFIYAGELADAFTEIHTQLQLCERADLFDEYEKLLTTYTFLLRYTFEGVNDPERERIFKHLQLDMLNLADNLKDALFTKFSTEKYYADKRTAEREIIKHNHDFSSILEKIKLIENPELIERKTLIAVLFMYLQSVKFTEAQSELVQKSIRSKALKIHEKALIVSSLTVSLLNRFDEHKIHTLFAFYDANQKQIWQRAIVGIVLAFFVHDSRIQMYPALVKRLEQLSEDNDIEKNIEQIVLQFTKTKETKKISDKLQNDILPQVSKMKLADKLDLDKLLTDKQIEDFNPDWEEVFEDAPDLLNKMEEISKLQLDGTDVFMTAFSQLKNFPFFTQTHNWFMPFYKENSDAVKALATGTESFDAHVFADGLQRSAYICNSDKYSFCMNIAMLPESQKKMIAGMFKMELHAMKDIDEEDELLQKGLKTKHLYTRYIQDLYRFYKLHPWGKEQALSNIFDSDLDFYNTFFYKFLIKNETLLRTVAEFYFKKEFYHEALLAFGKITITEKNARRIFEKMAFASQNLGDFEQAASFYERADLYDGNQLWLNTKLAFCYRKLQKFDKALEFYKRAEADEPQSTNIQANVANCLLNLGKYNEALQYYFKLEYLEPDTPKILRPLAWCALVSGKIDTALKYYDKLIALKPNEYDFINHAHTLLVAGRLADSVQSYNQAIKKIGVAETISSIHEDAVHLTENGVEQSVIQLLTDFLKLS
jgi:tetratricopeptide (TPR) repeat protein